MSFGGVVPNEGARLPGLCEALRSLSQDKEQICGSGHAAATGRECWGAGAALCLDRGGGGGMNPGMCWISQNRTPK